MTPDPYNTIPQDFLYDLLFRMGIDIKDFMFNLYSDDPDTVTAYRFISRIYYDVDALNIPETITQPYWSN